jgi:hypothetical protein
MAYEKVQRAERPARTREARFDGNGRRASPVTATPVTTVPAAMPTPVTPVPVMPPAHLLRLKAVDFGPGGDRGTDIPRRQPAAFSKRVRRKWRCLRSRGQRDSARGKSSGKFQKVAAFHDIFSSSMARDAEEILIASR